MPLTPEQKQELMELKRLDELEAKFGSKQPNSAPGELFSPAESFGEHAANTASLGYLPHLQAAASKPIYAVMNALTGQNIEPDSYVEERDRNIARQESQVKQNPKAALAGDIAGAVASPVNMLGGGAQALALQGLAYNPGDVKGEVDSSLQLPERAGNALTNLILGKGIEAAGKGALKGGDYLMQKAVGIKKYNPGLGLKLADEGIIGTRGQMQNQVSNALSKRGEELNTAVGDIMSANLPAQGVAQDIAEMSNKYRIGGKVPVQNQPTVSRIEEVAQDIASRRTVTPEDALRYKRAAQDVGYNHGEPLSKLNSKLAQQEARGWEKVLEDAYAETNPGKDNAVKEANSALSSLLFAKKGLNAPESISQGAPIPLRTMLMGSGGAAVGGPIGGLGGIGLDYLMRQPVAQSIAARAAIGAGKGLAKVRQPTAVLTSEARRKK